MNIYQFCERFNISLTKARKMHDAKVLRLDAPPIVELEGFYATLSRGKPLTAAQLVDILDGRITKADLGRYENRIHDQIKSLGKPNRERAPKEIAACITDASRGDVQSAIEIVNWIKQILPDRPVTHNYIAVRLLLGLSPNIRKYDIPRIPRAMLNCRKQKDFLGWWHTELINGRSTSVYQRPE